MEGIAAKGDILINSNHEVQETRAKLDSLSAMWTELKAMSDKIRRERQDALDMYNLQSAIDAIQSVVREKEYMSNVSGMLNNAAFRSLALVGLGYLPMNSKLLRTIQLHISTYGG